MRDQSYLLKLVNLFNKEISIPPFNFRICDVYHILKSRRKVFIKENNHFWEEENWFVLENIFEMTLSILNWVCFSKKETNSSSIT